MTTRLQPGDRAPAFTLSDDEGNPVSLSDFAGQRVIVYFYPAAMTPGCSKQACDFTATREAWRSGGYAVVGISPDPPEQLATFRRRDDLSIVLLSDPGKEVLVAWGAYGTKQLYGKEIEGVIRSTFVVGEDGVIELAQYNVKAIGHVAKLQRDLGVPVG